MKTETMPIQYCHSIRYAGINPKLTGNRMTLRIEDIGSNTFLVTKTVCSRLDVFRKQDGRKKTDLRRMIHDECTRNSLNYSRHPALSGSSVSDVRLPDKTMISIPFAYETMTHSGPTANRGTNIATIFTFAPGHPPERRKDLIEAILVFYNKSAAYA